MGLMGERGMKKEVFVFGSNLAGRHGAGSAAEAVTYWGAVYGIGEGRQGNAYAIPTKDAKLRTLPLEKIRTSVALFIGYARANPEIDFRLVAIGCGLAGYAPAEIAPMFADAPPNVKKPREFS